ncbi:hypothetical protein L195_g006028 [Trifolium pratense]|uniref:Uncharacterized protein n=1 Tax=Trifolium pratense TaxID=57577 RepID=A0A2K3P2F4_TRIPR|nr:hypothetical protein L195_g006028 [Trifolium pratense]
MRAWLAAPQAVRKACLGRAPCAQGRGQTPSRPGIAPRAGIGAPLASYCCSFTCEIS